jgi:hypothetical protein
MQKTKINTALAIFFVATAVVLIGGSTAMMTTTQTAEAKLNDCSKEPGEICRAGGEARDEPGTVGGSGGHLTCEAADDCTTQGGGGIRDDETGDEEGAFIVGGSGFRITGDFGSGDAERVGGDGRHLQGPGGNSE